ncbi:MAG: carboxypeptidase regulatory-like domain-containing protein [Edaphobacter sp.]
MSRQIPAVCLKCLFSLVVLLSFGLRMLGQSSTSAAVSGIVQDFTDARIRDASVKLINVNTGTESDSKTGGDGSFVIPSVNPGRYRLLIERQGFDTTALTGIVLNVGDNKAVLIRMKVGSSSQTVTVEDSGINMNTTDATVSTVIDRQLIENMPLNGKDMQTLFELSPGTILNAGGAAKNGGGFSVDGQRPTANYLTIDGASGNAYVTIGNLGKNVMGSTIATSASGGTNGILPIDAIEEYRMDTSTYTAENGRTPGGQIQVRTRSGTNEFHGTLFENFRNQVMDARDWFVKYNNIAQSQLRMNDFGGTFGGPIMRAKLFFFVAHDTLALNQPTTSTKVDVPSQSTRQSAAAVFQPYLAAYPLGNGGADPSYAGFDFYNASQPFIVRNHTTSIRLDSRLPRSIGVFFRANVAPSSSKLVKVSGLDSQANIYTYTGGITVHSKNNLANDFSINRTSNNADYLVYVGSTGGNDPAAIKNNLPTGVNPSIYAWGVVVGNKAGGGAGSGPQANNILAQWNVIDTLSWQLKRHTLKFGGDFLSKMTKINQPHVSSSVYLAYGQPSPFPNFQNGIVDDFNYVVVNAQPVISAKNLSLFANDGWRVSPSLVFNIGLRWEYNPPPSVGPLGVLSLQGANLDPATVTASVSKQPLYKTVYDNFAPRLGFAWTVPLQSKFTTVLRGGAGIYFDTGQATTGAQAATSTYPYQTTAPITTNVAFQSINWAGLTGLTPSTLPQSAVYLVDSNLASPRTYEWSLTLEQALGSGAKLSTSYVGNDGEKLIGLTSYYNKANSQGTYPVNTGVVSKNGYLYLSRNQAHSNYQALQMQFTGRMANRFDALFSYTWAHAEDNGSTEFSSVGGLAANPIANSANDIRHAFSGAIHYTPGGIKGPRIVRALTSGWQFDTIARLQTSPPFSVTISNTNPNSFLANADVVSGQPIVLHQKYNSFGVAVPGGRLINYNAFISPPKDSTGNILRQGNSPTNGYRLFALKQWDLAASHSWQIYERVNLYFRVDAFNILNIVNFAEPYTGWSPTGASIFGVATSTYASANGSTPSDLGQSGTQLSVFQNGGNRSLQLALKIKF